MNISAKTKRGFLFIENSDYQNAVKFFEEALNENPEDSYAYIGKLLVELKINSMQELTNITIPLENNVNFKFAMRFGDEKTKARLSEIEKKILNNIETKVNSNKEQIYNQATNILNSSSSKEDILKAIDIFESLGSDYKDVSEKILLCKNKIIEFDYDSDLIKLNSVYSMPQCKAKQIGLEKLKKEFSSFEHYKDSAEIIDKINNQLSDISTELEKSESVKSPPQKTIVKVIAVILVAAILSLASLLLANYNKNRINNNFVALVKNQEYQEAFDYFDEYYNVINNEYFGQYIKDLVDSDNFSMLVNVYKDSRNSVKPNIIKEIKANIKEDQYQDYYNSAFDLDDTFTSKIYFLYEYLSVLPEDFGDYEIIKEIYDILDKNNSFSTYEINYQTAEELVKYCRNFDLINSYFVSDFLSNNRWSNGDEYINFKEDGHCTYSLPVPGNSYLYDYYRLEDGKYILHEESNENYTLNVFKFTFLTMDKIEVYAYANAQTYILERN